MTKKGLYMLSDVACASGYVWLAASSMHAEEGVWRGCLFKQFLHIPCPACGSTRALIALCQGHWKESLLLNPNGVLLAVLMLLVPGWILLDIIKGKDSFFRFYLWVGRIFIRKRIFIIFLFLVLINWCWNIYKGL